MDKKVYEIKECMQMLGLSRNTITKLIKTGQLKAVRAGERRWLIPAVAIDQMLGTAE